MALAADLDSPVLPLEDADPLAGEAQSLGCPWPKLDLKGVDHTTGSLQTAADKESQKSAVLRDERSVNGSPV